MKKKTKIGILTFHFANNYGAVMQTYALYNCLLELGYQPTIINRIPNYSNFLLKTLKRRLNKLFISFFSHSFTLFRRENFKSITNVIASNKKMKDVSHMFDTIIVGSDQIWRMDYTEGLDYNYFLDFADENVNKISYAASFGKDSFCGSEENKRRVRELLSHFDSVSVREDSAVQICKNVFNIESQHVLDPTLLLENYSDIISDKEEKNLEEYIATYFLDSSVHKLDVAAKMSSRFKIKTKNIYRKSNKNFSLRNISFPLSDYSFPKVESWLGGIKRSSYVVTDSFHGVIFSILFEKQFVCIGNKERGLSRITSLLKMFELDNRLVLEGEKLNEKNFDTIDYEKTNRILRKKRKESLDFMISALSKKKSICN
ncbi:polysaccharide pyruvyl transferase family protein [Marinifilum sp.]|uniref:polysaccharide pyruvyl transferase family protein n=1 Tax=Marinifilum sp. TaxID=2033137 RepID=UPI003BABF051